MTAISALTSYPLGSGVGRVERVFVSLISRPDEVRFTKSPTRMDFA